MSKTVNKGRDFYREQQARSRYLSRRILLPAESNGQFFLSRVCYEKKHIKSKVLKTGVLGADGKEIKIPHETCTYVTAALNNANFARSEQAKKALSDE